MSRIEDALCWAGSMTGIASAGANAVITSVTAKVVVFAIMAISCILFGAWAYRMRNTPVLLAEIVYFAISIVGLCTHMGLTPGV